MHRQPIPPPAETSEAPVAAVQLSGVRFGWVADLPPVIDIPDLEVGKGERLFVAGPSGSGKSTLLSLLAGVVTPRVGTVRLLGRDTSAMAAPQRDHFRADHVGYIFQQFNLVPYLSVVENVTLPLRFSRKRRDAVGGHAGKDEAMRLLDHLGLSGPDLPHRSVTELSVGQQQRVAAARALIGGPEILIADEPTSSLDADNRSSFLDLLFRECEEAQSTLVFVSHDRELGKRFGRVAELDGGVGFQVSGVRRTEDQDLVSECHSGPSKDLRLPGSAGLSEAQHRPYTSERRGLRGVPEAPLTPETSREDDTP